MIKNSFLQFNSRGSFTEPERFQHLLKLSKITCVKICVCNGDLVKHLQTVCKKIGVMEGYLPAEIFPLKV
jgi:hypothetical protein